MKRVTVLLIFLFVSASTVLAQQENKEEIKALKQAEFTTLEGEKVSLDDFKGKLLIVDFWETWCSPCIKSFSDMQKIRNKYADHFAVLAVNPGLADKPKDIRKFVANNDYDFTFVRDTGNISKKLGIRSLPYKIFISPDGTYIKTKIGTLPDEVQRVQKMLSKYTSVEINQK